MSFSTWNLRHIAARRVKSIRGINIFHTNTSGGGYPQVTDEAVIAANPQFVILTEDPTYGGNPALVYKRPNWGSINALKQGVRQS